MRISVMRTGGFGGQPRRGELTTEDPEITALARAALADGRDVLPVGVPDGFSYEIEVDGQVGYAVDPRLTEAQRRLISRVLRVGA